MIIRMALRNLLRHRKRTILTLVTMITGIYLAILGEGLNSGLENQLINTYLKTDISLYKIYGKGFYRERYDNNQLEYPILQADEIASALKGKDYTSRLLFEGSVTNGLGELSTTFYGVVPEEENRVFNREAYMVSGKFVDRENSLVLGVELARLLDLKLGDNATIIARTASKAINAYDIIVTGIIKTGNPLLDSRSVFIHRNFAMTFTDSDSVNDIALGSELVPEEISRVEQFDIDFIPWERELKEIFYMISVRRRAFAIISFTILMMAGVGIANTMLMAMLERKKEIGIMMANGMSRIKILSLFLSEGVSIGVIGSFIGFILGGITNLYYQNHGISLGVNSSDLGMSIPLSDKLYLSFSLEKSLLIFFIGILFSLIYSLYPALKSTKLQPSEAIRD